jgi:DNA modification methylase
MIKMAKEVPINQIICGDCLKVMKDWPDGCVDLVLTDPEWQNWNVNVAFEWSRVLSKGRHIFVWWHPWTAFLIQPEFEKHFRMLNIIVLWRKNFCGQVADKERLPMQWYPVFFGVNEEPKFSIAKRKFELKLASDVWSYITPQSNHKEDPKFHKWQKDLISISAMIKLCTEPEDVVLDTYCGSGTTCVAAKKLGRRYIGIDISEEYCEIARERLKAIDTGVPAKEARAGQKALFQ